MNEIKSNKEIQSIKELLLNTKHLLKREQESERLRGEKFNVFSILNVTTREDQLHSSFIRELLDVNGSHLKGRLFLDLFIKMLNQKHDQLKHISSSFKEVIQEFPIGRVDLDDSTGGRIDLLLKGTDGKSISIENKIYAIDQPSQVARYCNYNSEKNTVYYLTLFGIEPSNGSKLDYKSDKDFYLLSYKTEIYNWLLSCLKEAYGEPILRESIKQYIITIQKLTNTMDEEFKKELSDLIIDNVTEIKHLLNNYDSTLETIREQFRTKLNETLKVKLLEIFVDVRIETLRKSNETHSALFLKSNESIFNFGVEPFSGSENSHFKGEMFVGLFADNLKRIENYDRDFAYHNNWWHHYELLTFKGNSVNLSESYYLKIIQDLDTENAKELIEEISNQAIEFIKVTNNKLLENHKVFRVLKKI